MNEYLSAFVILAFILGTSVGSFVNVVVFRLRSGATLRGRSKCLSCAKPLHSKHLIPLVSYLYQKGRCAFCGVRLSFQYPAVEAMLGVLYVAVFLVHDLDPLQVTFSQLCFVFLDMVAWTTLLAITVYDLKHKIIPDGLSLLLALTAGAALFLRFSWNMLPIYELPATELGYFPSWIDLASGPLLFLPFAVLWYFSGGRAMGLGDAKLAWGIGWFLGFPYAVTAIVLAFWIAFFPSLALLFVKTKKFTMKSEIPFAPFLVVGTLLVYLSRINIFLWTI